MKAKQVLNFVKCAFLFIGHEVKGQILYKSMENYPSSWTL